MVKYSLLLATLDRVEDVDRFLASLSSQTFQDFEVLVIDQNEDDRLVPILDQYSWLFPIQRLRCARGHSRAFNHGLAHARGEFVAFPDDDCWYDPDLLERVAARFAADRSAAGITGREIVEPGFVSGGRWDPDNGPVKPDNVWSRAITFSIFLRREIARRYRFDETLGVGAGTPWGAGEETDFLLQLIEDGHEIHYDPFISVWHRGRSGPYTRSLCAKAASYGRGMGRVLAKHRYPWWEVARHLVRPAGGTLISLMLGRFGKAAYHWSIFKGRAAGWLSRTETPVQPDSQDPWPVRKSRSLVAKSEDVA